MPEVDVLVVVVAHDGAVWLPRTLRGLASQSVRPRAVVGVDTGSGDGSAALLAAACDEVVALPADVGYPDAVVAAVARGPRARWLWLLHDDSAPARDALAALLAHARADPSCTLLGPKVVDWSRPRRLVEVGLTVDGAGHRETGLERGEQDQGQHDAVREVLAVGTAGALVRRDAWDALGGLDPALPLLREDVDLGWRVNAAGGRVVVVPRAVVAHARATTTGQRHPGALRGRSLEAVDRRHALLLRLAHAPRAALPLHLLLLVTGALLCALGLLVTRQVRAALDEVSATAAVLLHPGALRDARRTRSATRRVPASVLRPLFAQRRTRARRRLAALVDRMAGGAPEVPAALPAGPEEAPDELPPPGDGLLRRPGVLLALGLLAVALLAERALLPGSGPVLAGGRLLPAPSGAADLWAAYGQDGAPPALALLAALATLLLGSAPAAVDVVLLLSVPLAGASAYLASREVVQAQALRLWAAATWALLPVATGGVAAGRLDSALCQVLLPPLLLLGVRLLGRPGPRAPWRTGLLLTAVVAVAPVLWLLAAVLLLGAALARPRRLPAVLTTLAVPVAVLLPWSVTLPLRPAELLHGPWPVGPELSEPVGGLGLALLHPGGPGLPPVALGLGLLLAALGATVRRSRRRTTLLAWAVALAGLVAAVLLVRAVPGGVRVWPGPALQVAAAGLLVAALVAGDGLRARLSAAAFGAPQLAAGAVVVLAAATPVLLGGGWVVRGADGPLTRDPRPVLPAFVRAELDAAPGLRALVLAPRPDGAVGYALVGGDGARLGDRAPAGEDARRVSALVADLVTPRGSTAATALAGRGVRYVALPGREAGAAAALDAQRGLVRRSADPVALWQVSATAEPVAGATRSGRRTLLLAVQALALVAVLVLAAPAARRRDALGASA